MSNREKPRRSEVGGRGRKVYVVALAAAALLGLSRVDLGAVSTTMRQQDEWKSEPAAVASANPAPVIVDPSSLVTVAPVMLASLTTVGVGLGAPQTTADIARLPAAPGPEAGQLAALTLPAAAVEPGATAAVSRDFRDPAPTSNPTAGKAPAEESYVVIGSYARLEVAARHVARNRHWKPVILPVMVDGRRRNLVAIGPFLRQQLAETLQLVIWDGFGDAWAFSPGSDSRIRTALTDGPIGSGHYR